MQGLFQRSQPGLVITGDPRGRDAGGAGDDLRDLGFIHHAGDSRVAGFLGGRDPGSQLGDVVAPGAGILIAFFPDGPGLLAFSIHQLRTQGLHVFGIASGNRAPCTSNVDQVDRLVGQLTVGEVSGRECHRGLQSRRGVLHLVVVFVGFTQAFQDGQADFLGRFGNGDLAEAAGQSAVLLHLAEFIQRGGADQVQLFHEPSAA